jgi:DNA-binding PadR family transcriptional regulator
MTPRGFYDPWSAWGAFCGPGYRFRGGRRGRGRRRVFEKGDLKYMILRLLEEKPMHGYEVMQRLEEESGGFYSASPGSVYPVLQMLQDEGYLASSEVEGKRVYALTDEGREFLRRHRERVKGVAERVSDFGDAFGGRGMGELTRAFVRLAQVSFERATESAGDPDSLARLRDILEGAAKEIDGLRRTSR